VTFARAGKIETVGARFLLVNFGRNVLAKFAPTSHHPDRCDARGGGEEIRRQYGSMVGGAPSRLSRGRA
jgi:hypothetical protein